jgi:2-dehydropantoate 2-reductase
MRIGIYGCGAMGTVLGAYLSREGVNVELIDIYEEHVNKLNRDGATLIGFEKWTTPVKAVLPSGMEGIYDLIILFCKQTVNKEAFEIIEKHINANSSILTLQNGYPEPSLIEKFGETQILGGTVLWGATFVGPGVSEVTEPLSIKPELFEVGTISGEINDRVKLVVEILGKMGPTQITANLVASRWTKLVANSSMSGMSAALGCTFGDILINEDAMTQVGRIGAEAGLVSKAAGQRLAPLLGADIEGILKGDHDISAQFIKWVESHYKNLGAAKASMLQDLEKGKITEVDMINGYFCAQGRKYGVLTPANDSVVEIVHGIETGKYTLAMSNLKYFK